MSSLDPLAIYRGSNGDDTKALYARLEQLGPIGVVALNLFRAQKASERAKQYSRRYKGEAYHKKQWSMANLCEVLGCYDYALSITWGWGEDPAQEFHRWVLYVDLPTGQVSFHTADRITGPDYPGKWDGVRDASPARICSWVSQLLAEQAVPA